MQPAHEGLWDSVATAIEYIHRGNSIGKSVHNRRQEVGKWRGMEGYCCFFLLFFFLFLFLFLFFCCFFFCFFFVVVFAFVFFFAAVSTRAWESNHILYTVRIKTAEYRTSTNRIVDRGNSQEGCCYQHVKVCICRTSYHSTSSCLRFTLRRDAVFSMSQFESGLQSTVQVWSCRVTVSTYWRAVIAIS